MYIVHWRKKGETFINKEYCITLEEAERWVLRHSFINIDFCHIQKES